MVTTVRVHMAAYRTLLLAVAGAVALAVAVLAANGSARASGAYDYAFHSIEGAPLPLSQFEGHPILLVNTASFCGYTHQYEGLQTLWERYREAGLIVLGVPSNQFGGQEPGSATEIKHFCTLNYDITFPMTEKQIVRGDDAHPLYQWARHEGGNAAEPRWNFHKILIAADGSYAGTWPTQTDPLSGEFVGAVEALLNAD